MKTKARRFDIALTFPGDRRKFVEQVAELLAQRLGQKRILYDRWYEAEFGRLDLDTYLQTLYHDQSTLIAVFLSAEYARKTWCGLEWKAVRDLINQRQTSGIMPLRFDDTEIPGLFFRTDGYVWISDRAPEEVADLIFQRWQNETGGDRTVTPSAPTKSESRDEYAFNEDFLLKLLDHDKFLNGLHELLSEATERLVIAMVDAFVDDFPEFLADHIYIKEHKYHNDKKTPRIHLTGRSIDRDGVWRAITSACPNFPDHASQEEQKIAMRRWIEEECPLQVFYIPVVIKDYWREMPTIVRLTRAVLNDIVIASGSTKVLALFACLHSNNQLPWRWRLFVQPRLARIDGCRRLGFMPRIDQNDIHNWIIDLPEETWTMYHEITLKSECYALFTNNATAFRFLTVRNHLVNQQDGAFKKARKAMSALTKTHSWEDQ